MYFKRFTILSLLILTNSIYGAAFIASEYEELERNNVAVSAEIDFFDYCAAAKEKYYNKLRSLPWGTIAAKYIDELCQEENQLMKEFFETYKVSPEEFYKEVENCKCLLPTIKQFLKADLHQKKLTKLEDKNIQRLIKEQLVYCDLDPEIFTIYSNNGSSSILGQGDAGCLPGLIMLNPKKIPSAQIPAIILHEIMHLLHKDSLIASAFKTFGINTSDKFLNKYQKFAEKRADILAALSSPKNTNALAQYMNNRYKLINYLSSGLFPHPSAITRFNYLKKIYNQIETDKDKKSLRLNFKKEIFIYLTIISAFVAYNKMLDKYFELRLQKYKAKLEAQNKINRPSDA